ncbi:IucA/IucC family protein [Paenibacillus arenilitoris]|uniref:IucA/IucC family siderophore biosynthesis protein n=1 Tax=Paenibacillus arenilitoris TaxID=2772299 RepID=A0A927H7H7_9BACL|nr:IucA/IucC family protein [Paenibacillus arenilitoris]MBD2870542.1 IucA/IucC family siderophore biosynthesis protein [Paenibacillus arenilitoris]
MSAIHLTSVEDMIHSHTYAKARRRVLVQLIEALLYERLAAFTMNEAAEREGEEIRIEGRDAGGAPVFYVCEGRRTASFGRIRLSGGPIMRVHEGEVEEAKDPALLLVEIARVREAPSGPLAVFAREIEQTLLKEAAALHWRGRQGEARRGERGHDDLEGDVIEAHPYHPCFKSRIGFTLADNEAYGPEFHPRIKLLWLAVRKEDMEVAASGDADWERIIREDVGEAAYALFEERLAARSLDPSGFAFVPVHPWQWREQVASVFYRELAAGRIVELGEGEALYSPQQSIRSLANRSDPAKLTVKLSLGIRNTSSLRTISPRHARNGPATSDRLSAIVRGDEYLRDKLGLVLLKERLGMSYRYELLPEPVRAAATGSLGAIWRDSIHRCLAVGEEAVPFTALCHVGENGRPYIDRWLKSAGLAEWLKRLLDVTLRPVLHLLFAHGVALESHAQNLTLIHRNGAPVRLAAKDFSGGVLFYNGEAADPALPETDQKGEVRDVVHNALFFMNLAELARLLDKHYGWPEERFWQATAEAVRRYERDFPELRQEFAAYDLFGEKVFVGLLAARRMRGESGPRDHWVSNALYDYRHRREGEPS